MEAQAEPSQTQISPDAYPANIWRTKLPLSELKPETLKYLTGWTPPLNKAYVLFEARKFHIGHDQKATEGTGLFTLSLEARPEQESKVTWYVLKKRFRVIDWGNFPRLNHPNPERAAKAKMYSGAKGANPWDMIEQVLIGLMNTNPNWRDEKTKYIEREQGFRAKIAALEAELEGGQSGRKRP